MCWHDTSVIMHGVSTSIICIGVTMYQTDKTATINDRYHYSRA